jgi:hypothetical protein
MISDALSCIVGVGTDASTSERAPGREKETTAEIALLIVAVSASQSLHMLNVGCLGN